MTMANYITILRMALIFPILIFATSYSSLYNWVALLLFVIAGITDHLDGYIARKTGSTSSVGAMLDLVADKLLIIITLFFFIVPCFLHLNQLEVGCTGGSKER